MEDAEKAKHGAELFAHCVDWFEHRGIWPDKDVVEIMVIAAAFLALSIKEVAKEEAHVRRN